MQRHLGRFLRGFQSLESLPLVTTRLSRQSVLVSSRPASVGITATFPLSVLSKSRDFSLPNSSWSPEMLRLYEHYTSQCEVETASGEKVGGPWKRLPSYNRFLKCTTARLYLNKMIQTKARLFTRNTSEAGAAFEYVIFANEEEQKCLCIFQAGYLLEGPPGHVHGGAIATMIDIVTGTHATVLTGPSMTANLNINFRSPVSLGSTVLIESNLEKTEGRKMFISCKITSSDGSKLHTESTALYLSIGVSHLLPGK